MKVIIATPDTQQERRWRVDILPDSAILRDGKPLFLPMTKAVPSLSASVAFRAGRLGKNIAPKFAPRYFDAFALCVRMSATADEDAFSAAELSRFADNSLVVGDWIDLEGFDTTTASADILSTRLPFGVMMRNALTLMAEVSRFATIKMGDIVATDPIPLSPQPQTESIVTGRVNNIQKLRFRIK